MRHKLRLPVGAGMIPIQIKLLKRTRVPRQLGKTEIYLQIMCLYTIYQKFWLVEYIWAICICFMLEPHDRLWPPDSDWLVMYAGYSEAVPKYITWFGHGLSTPHHRLVCESWCIYESDELRQTNNATYYCIHTCGFHFGWTTFPIITRHRRTSLSVPLSCLEFLEILDITIGLKHEGCVLNLYTGNR